MIGFFSMIYIFKQHSKKKKENYILKEIKATILK